MFKHYEFTIELLLLWIQMGV